MLRASLGQHTCPIFKGVHERGGHVGHLSPASSSTSPAFRGQGLVALGPWPSSAWGSGRGAAPPVPRRLESRHDGPAERCPPWVQLERHHGMVGHGRTVVRHRSCPLQHQGALVGGVQPEPDRCWHDRMGHTRRRHLGPRGWRPRREGPAEVDPREAWNVYYAPGNPVSLSPGLVARWRSPPTWWVAHRRSLRHLSVQEPHGSLPRGTGARRGTRCPDRAAPPPRSARLDRLIPTVGRSCPRAGRARRSGAPRLVSHGTDAEPPHWPSAPGPPAATARGEDAEHVAGLKVHGA